MARPGWLKKTKKKIGPEGLELTLCEGSDPFHLWYHVGSRREGGDPLPGTLGLGNALFGAKKK